ncbi:MAG: hypothetical protein QG597_2464 [Actinomycetota bacterium]|nr:hypothetical protein [Actinomycetota bacterium]
MVDEARVQRLLRHLVDTVQYLESEAASPAEIRRQRRWLDSVKYNFIAAIECAVDIGQHICAVCGWGPPNSNAEVFALLADHQVVPTSLAEDLRRASGFRNVLVHDYVDIRDDLVIANLDRLGDLRSFAVAISTWLVQR